MALLSILAFRKVVKDILRTETRGAPGDGGQRHHLVQLPQVLCGALEQAPRVQRRVRQVVPDGRGFFSNPFSLLPRIQCSGSDDCVQHLLTFKQLCLRRAPSMALNLPLGSMWLLHGQALQTPAA